MHGNREVIGMVLKTYYEERERSKSEAGAELDEKARSYMSEHNVSDYARALEIAKIENPTLTAQYYGIEEKKDYMAEVKPAGAALDKKCQLKMLKHNLSYIEAFRLVCQDPGNSELVQAYMGEGRR